MKGRDLKVQGPHCGISPAIVLTGMWPPGYRLGYKLG